QMGPFELLTSFRGRIPRKAWWVGTLIIGIVGYVASHLIDPGVSSAEPPRAPNLSLTLWAMVLMVPATALAVKRFNDRDWPWWLGYGVGATGVALIVAQYFGIMLDPTRLPSVYEQIAGLLITAVGLFTLFE